jgi:hypothetical protein
MYRIIGGDGREYGPVSAEQVRDWIKQGRANAQTKIRPEAGGDWRTVGELPEFAAAPGAPPAISTLDAEQVAAEILARGYELRVGHCISRSWELTKKNFWLLVGACAVVGLIEAALGGVPILGALAAPLFTGVLNGGLFLLFLKLIRGQRADFGDAFAGFSLAFVPLMLAGLVSHLLTIVGLLCCILPGIYLAIAWMFTLPLVIDKRLDFWPAMELSRRVITRNWWPMFGLAILCFLIVLLGLLACIIGVFVAMPVVMGAVAFAYEDVFSSSRGSNPQPAAVTTPVTP